MKSQLKRLSVALVACATTSAFAAPITQSFSASVILQGNFAPGFASAHEAGFTRDNFTSPFLPSALSASGYKAKLNIDFSQPPPNDLVDGTFSHCAANGVDCVTGTITNFTRPASFGSFTRTNSISTITGGTGVYAGATGSWTDDTYGPSSFYNGNPLDYALFNFAKGTLILSDGTSHQIQNAGVAVGAITPTPDSFLGISDETGIVGRTNSSEVLPVTLVDYQADITFGPSGANGGAIKWCSPDGIDCLLGTLISFDSAPGVADFVAHVPSTTQITGGTGFYRGAKGFISNDVFAVNDFDEQGNVTGYTLAGFLDGRVAFGVPAPSTYWSVLLGLLGMISFLRFSAKKQ